MKVSGFAVLCLLAGWALPAAAMTPWENCRSSCMIDCMKSGAQGGRDGCNAQCSRICNAQFPDSKPPTLYKYGAIAVSPSTLTFGLANDMDQQWHAENKALEECGRDKRKPADCENVIWFKGTCGAMAVNKAKGAWAAQWGENKDHAEFKALLACAVHAKSDSCEITASLCAAVIEP